MRRLEAQRILRRNELVLQVENALSHPQPGPEFVRIERLAEVVVRARLQAGDHVVFFCFCREQQQVAIGAPGGPDFAAQLVPSLPGIIQSRIASLGASSLCNTSQACWPSLVAVTEYPHFPSHASRMRRNTASSSAIRMALPCSTPEGSE